MGKYIESEKLELKEKYSETISKEIVAFLNTSGGTIIIGVKDNGEVIGVDGIDETLKRLSDIITTQIEPNPQDEIRTEIKFDDQKVLICINVNKGSSNIYCQKKYGYSTNGCLARVGTTCKPMTPEEIRSRYESKFLNNENMLRKKTLQKDLTFRNLKIYYSEIGFELSKNSFERNLNLKNDLGDYNLLAELLADSNSIPLIFVKFRGLDKTSVSQRNDYGWGCLLIAYEKIKIRLQAENVCYCDTTVRPRIDRYLFDLDSVNEAVINAFAYNDWTISEPQISMFANRIEILSHGGLPDGVTKEAFFKSLNGIRNITLMHIFQNVGLTEQIVLGVSKIIAKYGYQAFEISRNYIKCTIPFNESVIKNVDTEVGDRY